MSTEPAALKTFSRPVEGSTGLTGFVTFTNYLNLFVFEFSCFTQLSTKCCPLMCGGGEQLGVISVLLRDTLNLGPSGFPGSNPGVSKLFSKGATLENIRTS